MSETNDKITIMNKVDVMKIMRTNLRILILAAAILLVSFGTVNASSCQTFSYPNIKVIGITWGNSTHYISAYPGDKDVPLTVTLETYDTNCVFENLVGSLQLYGGITNYDGSQVSTYYTQATQPPSIINMVFYLNIAKNVTMGPNVTVSYPLVLEWDSNNGSINNKQQINVQVPMEGAANLTFAAKNPQITAGKVTNVSITVSNEGSGIASNIGVTASSTQGVSFISQPNEIANLGPGESKNMTFGIYIAPSQSGNSQAGASVVINLNGHYISPYGHNTTLESQVGLFTSPPSQASAIVSVENQTLVAGRITETNLSVYNSGSDPITNLSVVLTPVAPLNIIGSDNLNAVPIVAGGKKVNLPITLYMQSSTSAVSTLEISMSYVLDNQQITSSRSISFLNPGNINMSVVSTVISPSSPGQGQIFSITSTVQNTGSQEAVATSVAPKPPSGINILGQNSTFLGSIPVDTPTALTVSFTVSPNAKPGEYTIPVVVSYLNNLNQKENRTFYYNVEIGQAQAAGAGISRQGNTSKGAAVYSRKSGSGGDIVIAIGVIVVAGAAYYLYRRKNAGSREKNNRK